MEREIKFEFILKDECVGGYAFAKLTYTLDELLELGISNDDIIEKATDEFSPANGMDSEFEIIAKRQSAGLKDKNMVDIYNGDIVKTADDDEPYMKVEYDFDDAMFCLIQEQKYTFNFTEFYGKELEVIGNIYENPELLEEEK